MQGLYVSALKFMLQRGLFVSVKHTMRVLPLGEVSKHNVSGAVVVDDLLNYLATAFVAAWALVHWLDW